MTMQLRYTIGIHLARRLFHMPPLPDHFELPLDDVRLKASCPRGTAVDARWKPYWAGSGRGNTWVGTWGCNVPASMEVVFQIRGHLFTLQDAADDGPHSAFVRGGARTLSAKLSEALGLPLPLPDVLKEPLAYALCFAIIHQPCERANWLVYADWMEEHGGDADRARARLIRAMWGPKAMTMRYGIPLLARLIREPGLEHRLKGGI